MPLVPLPLPLPLLPLLLLLAADEPLELLAAAPALDAPLPDELACPVVPEVLAAPEEVELLALVDRLEEVDPLEAVEAADAELVATPLLAVDAVPELEELLAPGAPEQPMATRRATHCSAHRHSRMSGGYPNGPRVALRRAQR